MNQHNTNVEGSSATMPGVVVIALIQIIFINWTPCNGARLPKWVHRVDSCPDPTNISQWIHASKLLNCPHDPSTPEENLERVYQCMPSSFLNETVEFCGRNVPIDEGHCPIYNYEYGQNTQPTYFNCNSFTSGCPNKTFFSKEVFNHPACLGIISYSRCYAAQINCSYMYTSTAYPLTKDEGTTLETRATSTSNKVVISESADSPGLGIAETAVIVAIIFIVLTGAVIFALYKGKCLLFKGIRKGRNPNRKTMISEEDFETFETMIGQSEGSDTQETALDDVPSDTNLPNGHNLNIEIEETSPKKLLIGKSSANGQKRNSERESYLDRLHKGADKMQQNVLFEMLKKDMTTEIVNQIKVVLKDILDSADDLENIQNPEQMLKHLFKTYVAFHNITFLEGIFLLAKAPKLYDRCIEFCKKGGRGFTYFEERISSTDHTRTKYVVNCPDILSYSKTELKKLRGMLVIITNAQFGDILVSGVKTGCVIVTFMIRNCLIPTLRSLYTPEKLAYQWMLKLPLKHKIMKVMIEDEVIYMSDFLAPMDKLIAEAKLCGHVHKSCLKSSQTKLKTESPENSDIECEENSEISIGESDFNRDTTMMKKRTEETQELQDFLESIGGCITDDTLYSMKTILQEFMDEKSVKLMDTTKMLSEMLDLFKLQFNFSFLEWIFQKCGENDLVEKCQSFSSEKQFQLESFRTKIIPSPGNQHLELHIMVFELESFKAEIQKMKLWLADTICAHPGQVLMTALKNRPIVVTFMMKDKHADTFLKFLQTDDGQIAASRRRMEKIVINKRVIKIDKALSESNFVHVRLSFRRNPFGRLDKTVRNVTSTILRHTGLSMEGREILIRTTPSKTKGHDDQNDSKSEIFLRMNQNSLLENLEPMVMLEKSEISSFFNTEEITRMKKIESRKERAKFFLDKCHKLSREEKDSIVAHLKDILPSSEELPSPMELDPLKCWIEDNRETLLDEIDSDFIETTISHMEDVPSEVYTLCRDPSKGRQEKAKRFLEFALRKDDYVLALQKTLKENNIFFNERHTDLTGLI